MAPKRKVANAPASEAEKRIAKALRKGSADLDLSSLSLTSLPESLGQLSSLRILKLDDNELTSLPEWLGQLTALQTLNLFYNQLASVPESLGQLKALQTLYLTRNELASVPESLGQLTELQTLVLSGNRLTSLPESLGQLSALRTLDLTSNLLTSLPESLGHLTALQTLELSYNQLASVPKSLGQLTALRTLHLTNNELTSVPESLGQLKALQTLYLTRNKLTSVPKSLGQLKALQTLDLARNELTSVPESLRHLISLQTLDLFSNRLTSLPESLGKLTELQKLDLSYNQLTSLPETLGKLRGLQKLDLSYNQLTSLPESLGKLIALQTLDLFSNRLTSLPESLGKLTELQKLDLSGNRLTSIPESLGQLTALQTLDLTSNALTLIPNTLENLTDLKALFLHGNELEALLPEMLGPTWNEVESDKRIPASPKHLLALLRAMKGAKRSLNEVKILVLGEAKVGKTSLVDCLVRGVHCDPDLATDVGTRGVKIADWYIPVTEGSSTDAIKVNVWDFGGQEVQHPTHQFFLTERSLYLVVVESRQQEGPGRLEYWLKTIQSKGGDAPILVVVNKADLLAYSLDRRGLKERYQPNLQDFAETSCKQGDGRGVKELREVIQDQIRNLLSHREAIPETWFRVKEALEAETKAKDWINDDRYEEICKTNGVDDPQEREALIRLVHDLGVVVCFRDDGQLMHLGILNPEWVTDGVYTILTDDGLGQRKGELLRQQLQQILDPGRYPVTKHPYLLGLMKKFELCFEYEDGSGGRYLVADRLDPEQPSFEWNTHDEVRFLYRYPVLPPSIISRFIVRNHKLIGKTPPWKTGVVLEIDRVRALVRASEADRCIKVSVIGPNASSRRGAMTFVRKELERINASFKLNITEWVPHRYDPPQELSYKKLLTWEANRRSTLEIEGDNGDIINVNVREHLDGVTLEENVKDDLQRLGITNNYYFSQAGKVEISTMTDKSKSDVVNFTNSPVTNSLLNFGQISGQARNTVKSIPEQSNRNVAELKAALDALIDLIKDAPPEEVSAEDAKDALDHINEVAEAAKTPDEPGLLDKAEKALRSLKRMAGSFTAVTAAGKSFSDLVAGAGQWWSHLGK